jgi:mRNA-degrading endonuclease toxin of MazEF toxin-antitoxin module
VVNPRPAAGRGDVVDYMLGSRRIRVLVVSSDSYNATFPVVLVHDRSDGNVPGILFPLPADLAGGGTIDVSRIRSGDAAAFGHRHGRVSGSLMSQVDAGLRRLLAL